jgi:hypothetical protein
MRAVTAAVLAAHTVEVGDCLEWTGPFGHRRTRSVPILKRRVDGKRENIGVVRDLWEQAHGPVPAGRIVYRHTCCNGACVLLEHFKLGKQGDQHRRRKVLGLTSHSPGTIAAICAASRKRAKHTAEQALQVRELVTQGMRHADISQATGVSKDMVSDIAKGKSWRAVGALNGSSAFSWRPA